MEKSRKDLVFRRFLIFLICYTFVLLFRFIFIKKCLKPRASKILPDKRKKKEHFQLWLVRIINFEKRLIKLISEYLIFFNCLKSVFFYLCICSKLCLHRWFYQKKKILSFVMFIFFIKHGLEGKLYLFESFAFPWILFCRHLWTLYLWTPYYSKFNAIDNPIFLLKNCQEFLLINSAINEASLNYKYSYLESTVSINNVSMKNNYVLLKFMKNYYWQIIYSYVFLLNFIVF